MVALAWDESTKHYFETGLDHGVLYPLSETGEYTPGVAWNGLTSVSETPSGAEPTKLYADNIVYLTLISIEEFAATLEAYTFPEAFAVLDGSVAVVPGAYIGQQPRGTFGLAYRTRIGNDAEGDSLGYKLHLLWGLKAAPSERTYQTVNDSPEAVSFSWELSSTPVGVTGHQPTSIMVIDSTKVNATRLAALEAELFGSVTITPNLPMPDEVITSLTAV